MCEPLSRASSAVAIAASPEAKAHPRSAFQIGDAFFVSEPRRINRARVIEAFVFAWTFLHVGGCCVDRRDDRAGGWIGFLSGMDGARRELELLFHCLKYSNRGLRGYRG